MNHHHHKFVLKPFISCLSLSKSRVSKKNVVLSSSKRVLLLHTRTKIWIYIYSNTHINHHHHHKFVWKSFISCLSLSKSRVSKKKTRRKGFFCYTRARRYGYRYIYSNTHMNHHHHKLHRCIVLCNMVTHQCGHTGKGFSLAKTLSIFDSE